MSTDSSAPVVHFGGPDTPPRHLRDVLAARIAAVPGGGRIDWVTYYLRDRGLTEALLVARARGVGVCLTLEGHPRTPTANDRTCARLAPVLGRDLRLSRSPFDGLRGLRKWRPRLHEKLYCFSHPTPLALVGSFNPSGDRPEEDADVASAIGDQDRGHNALVEIRDPALAAGLAEHARRIHARPHSTLERFLPGQNRPLEGAGLTVHFRPRAAPDPALALLARCGRGARVRLTGSHLSGRTAPEALRAAAARGATIEVIAEATERRVPARVEERLREAGIWIRRLAEPGVPMHLKLLLVERDGERSAAFGSFNWTDNSIHHNRELVVVSREPGLFDCFAERFETLRRRLADLRLER
ncbi:MAG TPA: phospholipase D-like domain-containing protein [Myxococcota bacterium]|jgi:phosphatidylserine/phosphatidylglycerophosphate/cardiolipin synthase-like enzyme|nr:phospholipase D-like domain-containing protein [Myxococcota bacterium]